MTQEGQTMRIQDIGQELEQRWPIAVLLSQNSEQLMR
jgi:hypothetical protein